MRLCNIGLCIGRHLEEWVGVDVRSLAFFRIIFTIVQLLDLSPPWTSAVFLSDAGILPRSVVLDYFPAGWSIYMVSGSYAWICVVYTVHFLALVALMFGWRTQLAALAVFVCHTSKYRRNNMLHNSFDGSLQSALLFWSVSLPLASVYSIDNLQRHLVGLRSRQAALKPQARVVSMGTLALMAQTWVMYYTAMTAKTHPSWTRDFTALQLVLQTHMVRVYPEHQPQRQGRET